MRKVIDTIPMPDDVAKANFVGSDFMAWAEDNLEIRHVDGNDYYAWLGGDPINVAANYAIHTPGRDTFHVPYHAESTFAEDISNMLLQQRERGREKSVETWGVANGSVIITDLKLDPFMTWSWQVEDASLFSGTIGFNQSAVKDLRSSHRDSLLEYGEKHSIPSMDQQVLHGLRPTGMLAIEETSEVIRDRVGEAHYGGLVRMANEIQKGNIWQFAKPLSDAANRVVRGWYLLAYSATENNSRDIDPEEYVANAIKTSQLLGNVSYDHAVADMKTQFSSRFRTNQEGWKGISYSESDAFIAMAALGQERGVVHQGGNYLVGGQQLSDCDFANFAKEYGLDFKVSEPGSSYTINDEVVMQRMNPHLTIFSDASLAYGFVNFHT